MLKKVGHWLHDYLHVAHKHGLAVIYRHPPKHYLGHIVADKQPIILIPGVREKWNFIKFILEPLSLLGHPVYVIKNLGYNTAAVAKAAQLVRDFIVKQNLHNVIVIAHSKGGLIGKYLLAFDNQDARVKKMVTVSTPFGGSKAAKVSPLKSHQELRPEHAIIQKLQTQTAVNKQIVSIFGKFDNHVWPVESCRLGGAKNIQVQSYGHHKILFNKETRAVILEEVGKI